MQYAADGCPTPATTITTSGAGSKSSKSDEEKESSLKDDDLKESLELTSLKPSSDLGSESSSEETSDEIAILQPRRDRQETTSLGAPTGS